LRRRGGGLLPAPAALLRRLLALRLRLGGLAVLRRLRLRRPRLRCAARLALLALAAPAARARRARLRRGEVVRERGGDLLDRAEPLACVLEHLVRARGVAVGGGAQQRADTGGAILFPRRRLRDERDEVVEVGALDAHRDAVGERDQPQPPVRVLRGTRREEDLERALRRAALRQLLDERLPL